MKLSQNGQGKSFEETFYYMKNADLKTFYRFTIQTRSLSYRLDQLLPGRERLD